MRLGFLLGFMVIMWSLIIVGGYILIKIVAPIHLEAGEIASSILKAAIALSMVIIWIWILIVLMNRYVRRKLVNPKQ
jgi:TRAP-type C4-dicarboxylate transport system permease small subunit